MSTFFSMNEITDSSDRLSFRGKNMEMEFFNFKLNGLKLSYQDDFNSNFKIAGFSIFFNSEFTKYYRSTYTFMQLIGDFGGFIEGWLFIGIYLFAGFARIQAAEFFMQKAFYTTRGE